MGIDPSLSKLASLDVNVRERPTPHNVADFDDFTEPSIERDAIFSVLCPAMGDIP